MIASGAPMDTALQALRLQVRLDLVRAVGAVRPYPVAGAGEIEQIVSLLTVVHGRVGCIPFADQLVHLVHAEVVLVAVETLVVLLRPARVLVLLGILGGLLSHPSGVLLALIASFSCFVLRCLGTDTIVASMIWPPRAIKPAASRCWPKRSNSRSISPACAN